MHKKNSSHRKNLRTLSKTGIIFWGSIANILYTYFGYPLIISILARLKPKVKTYHENDYLVTLLIAAYNEEKIIEEKILNSLSLDYPKRCLQILVVADGSSDNTAEIVKKYSGQGVEVLFEPERRGKMAAINRAMEHVRGDIIVFSDANNFYQPNTIKELVYPFSNPEIGAVSGAKTIIKTESNISSSEGLYWKYESYIKMQESKLKSCTSLAGEICAVRKSIYQSPADDIINDDFYIAMLILKQGYRIVYAPDALSAERVSTSAENEITRRKRIIAGRYQAMKKSLEFLPAIHPLLIWQIISHKFMRPLVPFFMIGALLSNLLIVLRPPKHIERNKFCALDKPFNTIFLIFQLLFYGLAWLGNLQGRKNNTSKIERLLYLPTFLYNSNMAALLGFIQYVKGEQNHLWERVSRE